MSEKTKVYQVRNVAAEMAVVFIGAVSASLLVRYFDGPLWAGYVGSAVWGVLVSFVYVRMMTESG